jgi:GxxExxY protein
MFHADAAKIRANELSTIIIGAAIEVHKELGPGLLESAYEACLRYELEQRGVKVIQQLTLPVVYKGIDVECGYRIDLLVEDTVLIELKAVEKLDKIHEAQVLTYLKLSKRWLGLLVNFNVALLKNGIKRMVCDPDVANDNISF